MLIRDESCDDWTLVAELYGEAFESSAEARLVAALRHSQVARISLIIEEGMRLVGHIMFTAVTLDTAPELKIMGLAPMAVIPDRQRCGFGSALVEEGLVRCHSTDCGAVVALGYSQFYQKFGFEAASTWGISCHYEVPDDVFMVRELEPGYLGQLGGRISYHPKFDDL